MADNANNVDRLIELSTTLMKSTPNHGITATNIVEVLSGLSNFLSGTAASAPASVAAAAVAPALTAAETSSYDVAEQPVTRRGRKPKAAQAIDAPVIQEQLFAPPSSTEPAAAPVSLAQAGQVSSSDELSDDPDDPNYRFKHLSRKPIMNPQKAIKGDELICLIDGTSRSMIKRHLSTKYNMTPEQYRIHFSLPDDYPMTAPNYSDLKRDAAISRGFGKTKKAAESPAPKATPAQQLKKTVRRKTQAA